VHSGNTHTSLNTAVAVVVVVGVEGKGEAREAKDSNMLLPCIWAIWKHYSWQKREQRGRKGCVELVTPQQSV
jgi:hypothetical protein